MQGIARFDSLSDLLRRREGLQLAAVCGTSVANVRYVRCLNAHPSSEFTNYDPVVFTHQGARLRGHIAKKTDKKAIVVCDNADYRVPWRRLSRDNGGRKQRVQSRLDRYKFRFRPDDRVAFDGDHAVIQGTIARFGPKRALVVTNRAEYRVPYGLLTPRGRARWRNDGLKLAKIEERAGRLMVLHGLKRWSFQYDDATRRAGFCSYRLRVLSLSHLFAVMTEEKEVRDTILHEIAHALAGPEHNHDEVWKAKARSIGCTGDRCHTVNFAPWRYIAYCPNCGWRYRTNVRRRSRFCGHCLSPTRYQTYTKKAWEIAE